jgi:hypothetical protein
VRDKLLADRIRAAACVVLKHAGGAPLSLREIVDAVRELGIPIPAPANKTVSDLLRTELNRNHVRRYGWGSYRIGDLPRTTEQGMRRRIDSYVLGMAVYKNSQNGLTDDQARAIQQARAQSSGRRLSEFS